MHLDFLLDVFRKNYEKDAIVWKDTIYSYGWLLDRIDHWRKIIDTENIKAGIVTVLEADFSPNSVALFLVLIESGCILIPLTKSVETKKAEFIEIAQGEISLAIDENDDVHIHIRKLPYSANYALYQKLKEINHPGLVLFSSGSTGKSKAAVHDLKGILEKFKVPRKSLRTITFLLYDHIGGINTMFYALSNAGCIVTVQDRSPNSVLGAVEMYRVELLPTSPTFINMILLSEAYKRYNMKSLKTVSYGTEPMPESTLKRFHELFPQINLLQTYGLSEIGILRSKSKSSDSLWVKIGGEDFETRIVDGVLQIKAKSAMLGYLNAPSPFTKDGWFNTEDHVEVDGDYIKILGRKSEIINVGGEKVYPAEIESVIQIMDGVEEVAVSPEANSFMGQIIKARVKLNTSETVSEFRKRMGQFCKDKLPEYKIPQKVVIASEDMHGDRFKKMRQKE